MKCACTSAHNMYLSRKGFFMNCAFISFVYNRFFNIIDNFRWQRCSKIVCKILSPRQTVFSTKILHK